MRVGCYLTAGVAFPVPGTRLIVPGDAAVSARLWLDVSPGTLAAIMNNGKAPPGARALAANALLA